MSSIGDERGLAALREPHVACHEVLVDPRAERVDRLPLARRIRLGDARVLVDARHLHREVEPRLADIRVADDRRRVAGIGRARERQVALAGQQARRGIEADPSGAGNERLGPCVEVGEVAVRARRAVERLHVGDELDQVPGREARGDAEVTEHLNEQPSRVAARPAPALERLVGRLHARLHAHQIADLALELRIEADEQIDASARQGGSSRERRRATAPGAASAGPSPGTGSAPWPAPARTGTDTARRTARRRSRTG